MQNKLSTTFLANNDIIRIFEKQFGRTPEFYDFIIAKINKGGEKELWK